MREACYVRMKEKSAQNMHKCRRGNDYHQTPSRLFSSLSVDTFLTILHCIYGFITDIFIAPF